VRFFANIIVLAGELILAATIQCVLGYCLFPLLGAAVISMFLNNLLIRLPVSLIAWAWSVWGECDAGTLENLAGLLSNCMLASMNFLGGTKLDEDKKVMAVYPLGLFFGVFCLFCIQT
jgi:hypothetical protein